MAARYPSPPSTVSLREAVYDLFESLRAALTTRLELVALEGRRAGIALAQMLLVGVLGAILGISAWLVAIWGITWGLMALGLAPWLAIILVIVANLIGAWICVMAVKKLAQRLLFPATLKHLHVRNPPGASSLPEESRDATASTTASAS
ncbi:MAG: phage holin family protein [Burkholderiaceae bacterium]|nr:phage holin family protein [Burkholderiaceae bacterium]